MSALPLPVIEVFAHRAGKTERARQRKQRQREKAKLAGIVRIELELSSEESALVEWLRVGHSGPLEGFAKRALVVGAKFLYNSGNVSGGKKRFKVHKEVAK